MFVAIALQAFFAPAAAQTPTQSPVGKAYEAAKYYNTTSYANAKLQHLTKASGDAGRHSQWYERRRRGHDYGDIFSTNEPAFYADESNTDSVQATHTYVDTLYVKKGTSARLVLPIIRELGLNYESAGAYFRWYSYRTQSSFSFTHNDSEGNPADYDLLKLKTARWVESDNPLTDHLPYKSKSGYYSGVQFGETHPDYHYNVAEFYYPTDEEFDEWIKPQMQPGDESYINNRWYVIACDVSSYMDGTADSTANSIVEPTLSQRVLFYISGIDGNADDIKDTQAGGKYETSGYAVNPFWSFIHDNREGTDMMTVKPGGNYYEDYVINFPYRRFANETTGRRNHTTYDLVALTKDANSFYVPGATEGEVEVTLDDAGGSGIKLMDGETKVDHLTLNGHNRVVHFSYPNTETNPDYGLGSQTVNAENSYAYICVKSSRGDRLARYKLVFNPVSLLLTNTEVKKIESGQANSTLKALNFRTPAYLKRHFKEVTSLHFDYNYDPSEHDDIPGDPYGNKNLYPYPLAWETSSYAFNDGSNRNQRATGYWPVPQYGQYGITNGPANVRNEYGEVDSRYTLAPSPNPNNKYSLYVDASDRPGIVAEVPFRQNLCAGAQIYASAWLKNAVDVGHVGDDAGLIFSYIGIDKQGKRHVLYRQATGQFPRTIHVPRYAGDDPSDKDEWLQTYCSFTISSDNTNFVSYALRIENNCASTSGGDFYVDDIEIFVGQAEASVMQVGAICGTGDSRVQVKVDYEGMMTRMGETSTSEQGARAHNLFLTFVDSTKYAATLASSAADPSSPTTDEIINAVKAAKVRFGFLQRSTEGNIIAPTDMGTDKALTFSTYYDGLAQYDEASIGFNLPGGNSRDSWLAVPHAIGDLGIKRYLLADISGEFEANKKYFVVMSTVGPDNTDDYILTNTCAMVSTFTTKGPLDISMSGEPQNPDESVCEGQANSYTARLYAYINGERVELPQAQFDWFFGSEEEFYNTSSTSGTSVATALEMFRNLYPDKENFEGVATNQEFTQAMLDMLKPLTAAPAEANKHPKLLLRRRTISVSLFKNGDESLWICPIPVTLESDKCLACFSPEHQQFKIDGEAPQAYVGFQGETYPAMATPALRIGLAQIRKYGTGAAEFSLPLRGIVLPTAEATAIGKITATTAADGTMSGSNLDSLYLISSDDPKLATLPAESRFANTVGTIVSISGNGADGGKAVVRFDSDAAQKLREGYTYTLQLWFREMNGTAPVAGNACFGSVILPVKVVPEYLKWTGNADGNWNNDANWTRSYKAEIHKTGGYEDYADGHHGFVPMAFSKVTLPAGSQAHLYAPTNTGTGGLLNLEENRPQTMGEPSEGIAYDLMADEGATDGHKVVRYYANRTGQIHFEPGAEMLHTELLTYDRAWVDYELALNQWHVLSSPLQSTVAGDFYAPKADGRQATEYFKNITFNATDYDRFAPAIYQRSWDRATATRTESSGTTPSTTSMLVQQGTWSAAYNDPSVPFQAIQDGGTAFSLKPTKGRSAMTATSVLIRLPKDDATYTFYPTGSNQSTSVSIDRKGNAGKLAVIADNGTSATIPANTSGYYLVGNPFMAHLDMKKFFNENQDLQLKFWQLQQTTVNGTSMEAWVSTDGTSSTAPLIAPLQGFFVEVKDGSDTSKDITVKFTNDMQALVPATSGTSSATAALPAGYIRLNAEGGAAALVNVENETNGSGNAEVLLGTDENYCQPYTAAQGNTLAINASAAKANAIPVGILGRRGESIKVGISGIAASDSLSFYDAKTGESVLLTDSSEVEMEGEAHGRYFLLKGITNASAANLGISIYSLGSELIVASPISPLAYVRIYSTDGKLLPTGSANGLTSIRTSLSPGTYVVKAANEGGETKTEKIAIR